MSAPSWYGENVTTYKERGLALVEREGIVSQGDALDELAPFDSYRDGAHRGLAECIADGTVRMEWNTYGTPFYVSTARS